MEAIPLLGLAIGTIGLLLLAHGIFGKTPHDGLILIAILLGASTLIALMLMMWTRSFSPLVFAGSVIYGLLVIGLWGIGNPATPTVRGLVRKHLGNKKLVQKGILYVIVFSLGNTLALWAGNEITNMPTAVRAYFTAVGILAFLGLGWIGVDMLKRLIRRMPEPLLCVAGGALVVLGIAGFLAPTVLRFFHIQIA